MSIDCTNPGRHPSSKRKSVRKFVAASYAKGTRRGYESVLRDFRRWEGKLPATGLQVARYAAACAGRVAYATLRHRMAAIHRAH